jgi:hypothetical protein
LLEKQRLHDKEQEKKKAKVEAERLLRQKEQLVLQEKRANQLRTAREREESIKEKARRRYQEDEEHLKKLRAAHKREQQLAKEERDCIKHHKLENVERMKRMAEYKKRQTMNKLKRDEERTAHMLAKREELLKERREAARTAKIQKDEINSILGRGVSLKKMLELVD